MTPPDVERIVLALNEAGADVVEEGGDGFASQTTYQLNGLQFQLLSEYGRTRVNIGVEGKSHYPASFWIAALAGDDQFPDPAVTPEDSSRLEGRVRDLAVNGAILAPMVERMGEQYTESMRQRLG